jgi:curli biogenesis system outer membrane secretion channel CsgG
MKLSLKLLLTASAVSLLMSGCAQKVQIKALNPAEVGEMATKKKIAISGFKNDRHGLSGKIESEISKHKLDHKRYFTVVSRKDLNKIIAEQKLQSSELMDEATATRVGKLIGAQAIINGEIASATATSDKYRESREKCLKWSKEGCVRYKHYKVTCKTIQAEVSANINIVNVQTGSIIYGDTISKEYSADSCKLVLGFMGVGSSSNKILSKGQALNRLTSAIASEFVYKLTPHYIHFNVELIDSIELDSITDRQEQTFENALAYIKAGRMEKAEKILQGLMDKVNGKSYVVAYAYGVVNEAQGKFDEAKKLYEMADDLTIEPVDEINSAMSRIDGLIDKREEAKQQMNAK